MVLRSQEQQHCLYKCVRRVLNGGWLDQLLPVRGRKTEQSYIGGGSRVCSGQEGVGES